MDFIDACYIESMIRLNQDQLKKLSDIFSDGGILTTGSVVIPIYFDNYNPKIFYVGIVLTLAFWVISLILLRNNQTWKSSTSQWQ